MQLLLVTILTLFSLTLSCPTGTIRGTNPNFCYYFSTGSISWISADYKCRQMGGQLATIDSSFLNQILLGAGEVNYGQSGDFWFGKTTMFLSGQWLWADASNSTYSNWGPNQPVSNSGSYCSSMHLTDGKWYSDSCQTAKPYVCEIPQSTSNVTCPSTTCPPLPNLPLRFNGSWQYLDGTGKCYLLIASMDAGLPGYDAQNYCKQFGADNLVIIKNKIENDLVGHIMSLFSCDNYWGCNADATIGLYNNGTGWAWVDGSAVAYTNWGTGIDSSVAGVALMRYGNTTLYDNSWKNDQDGFWKGGSANFICQKVLVNKNFGFDNVNAQKGLLDDMKHQ